MAKNMLYVGGLAEEVKPETLSGVFSPFGDVTSVEVPLDPVSKKPRGFGFVTFESEDDAAQAIDNMNDAELFGRVLRVNLARQQKIGEKSRAIWATDRDNYDAALEKDKLEDGGNSTEQKSLDALQIDLQA